MIKYTYPVNVASIKIGGRTEADTSIPIQTMWKHSLVDSEINAIVDRLELLKKLGCDIVRFSTPTIEQAELLGKLASMTTMALVADIHFDWKIALRCMDFNIAKIRINPGNIGQGWKLLEVAQKASDKNIPLRIGVNSGSLPRDLLDIEDKAQALVIAAEREVEALDKVGFKSVIVSIKASSVDETIQVNRLFSMKHDIPLHIGVTEAGPLVTGTVRSTAALYTLLKEGIGDTIRVSLSAEPEQEVIAAAEIVALALGGRSHANIISCPRCGRASFDTHAFTAKWMNRIYSIKKPVTIAIMGCVVNGPGEAKSADLGISGAGNKVAIFKKGKIIHTCDAEEADNIFMKELSLYE